MKKSKEKADLSTPSVNSVMGQPETAFELINKYGTYNIQPTADTPNDFPAIAQGTPNYMEKRSRKFFRDGKDKNPARDTSDRHPL
jgi:hypothetical protein